MIKHTTKYGNKKVAVDGITFDSKREADRYLVLLDAHKRGLISELKVHPKFELVPKITEGYIKRLKTKDKLCQRTIQLAVTYTADFAYITKGNTYVIEDVKISPTMLPKEYLLKEKLFRYKYGFSIRRVFKPNEPI